MSTLTFDKALVKTDDIAVQDRFEDTYVLNLAASSVHCLGDIETVIWNAIDGRRSAREIAEIICRDYDVDPVQARQDVYEFLTDMAECGLIKEITNG